MSSTPQSEYEEKVLGWMTECLQESSAFLKAQSGYNIIPEAIKSIMGESSMMKSGVLSQTTINHAANIATSLTAMCTDVKPFWEYKSENIDFKKHCENLGKLSEHWWLNRLIDLKNADVVKYSIVAGSGFAHMFYNTNISDMDMSAEDPRDVLPIRPPSTGVSLQEAYGVIHRVQRTVNYVKELFPDKADKIVPDREGSMVAQSIANTRINSLLGINSPFHDRLFGDSAVRELPRIPSVDLYTAYIRDNTINEGSSPKYMGQFMSNGEPANNWSYVVKPGEELYPRKRCIVFTATTILYDGPSIYWHGLFPYCKLTLDPWPWSWIGKGILWDVLPIQKAINGIMRVVDDHLEQVARPAVIGDLHTISAAEMNKIDTRKGGLKIRQNMAAGKGITIQQPPNLPTDVLEILRYYEEKAREMAGVSDFSNMMKLGQMPAPETVERLQESMSPSVRLRSRVIETYMREFATITAYNFSQFYPLSLRLSILGAGSATPEDFDQDPGTFIPAYLAEDYSSDGVIKTEALVRGPLPRCDRSKVFFQNISYHIAPSSLLNASEIESQLKYMQLSRAGLVDHWTLLEKLNIPNVGNPPDGANTITERLQAEQQMGMGMIVSSSGRKSSGQEMPQQKSSGAVSESG